MTWSGLRTTQRDTVELVEGTLAGTVDHDHAIYCRVAAALAGARAVYVREACWTRYGAHYMRVPFQRWG